MSYRIFAALHEETNGGWIWLKLEQQATRTTIKLRHREKRRNVYCEYREIDEAFVRHYNEYAEKFPLPQDTSEWGEIIVISDWYRRALGGLDLQTKAELKVAKPFWSHWADLRAACQHPEPGTRVATRLSIFGTWLAISGLLFALQATYNYPLCLAWVATFAFLVVAFTASRGVKNVT